MALGQELCYDSTQFHMAAGLVHLIVAVRAVAAVLL
jgi:hypothetical protein